ncbi:MAG: hypothetical protein HYU97_06745 [Deltaproteobacteria bacterium]|nr:hypothetical protein [Deltaproteobacteria bacterium]
MDYNKLKGRLGESDLPASIKEHLILGINKNKTSRWHEKLAEDNFKKFPQIIKETNERINMACDSTKLDAETLIKWTDFDPKDLDLNRLDSALGEIRAINFFYEKGFSVSIQKRKKSSKSSDLILTKDGQKIAYIEVTTWMSDRMSEKDNNLSQPINDRPIYDYLSEKWKDKKDQVTSAQNLKYYGIVFVINKISETAWRTRDDFYGFAKKLWEKIGDEKLVIGIVTGWVNAFTGESDDVLYPDLEKNLS